MKELVVLVVVACGSLAAALLLGAWGAWQRRRQPLYAAGIVLLLSVLSGGWAAWRGLHKAYTSVAGTLRPRTGREIYAALLGAPRADCVQVLNYQDQVVPRIDYAIWLHYRTCPLELKRVLARHPFTRKVFATHQAATSIPNGEALDWFKPAAMSDTIVVYEYAVPTGRNIQTLWVSTDSTEVFCRDVLD